MIERILAILIFIVLFPVFILIVLGILIEGLFVSRSRGLIFYIEERMSLGRPFCLFKFRTFSIAAIRESERKGNKDYGVTAFENQKSNLTFMGRFMKKFYLDEFPQIFNIIRGEMSFIGPRPLIYKLYEEHKKNGNFAKDQLKAGWTGPWQSRKGSIHTFDEIIKVENEYAEEIKRLNDWQRLGYNLKIILRTFKVVCEGKSI